MSTRSFGNFRSLIMIALITGLIIAASQIAELLVLDKIVTLELFLSFLVLLAFGAGLLIAKFKSTIPGEHSSRVNMTMLTAREMDIFLMLFNGKTNKEIAATCSIELSTVKTHVNNLYTKLQVSNRKEARELYRKEVFSRTPPFVHPAII